MTTTAPSALSFPRETFAKLSPAPFLLAHLKPTANQPPTRPSGRSPTDFRNPTINTSSLTHSHGSAVVRVGDTAIVCGVRAEVLRVQDIPQPYRIPISTAFDPQATSTEEESNEVQELGLLVPNLELSTGCSPSHLPGNPPSSVAQSLSHRLLGLLHTSRLIPAEELRITYKQPAEEGEEEKVVTKAYWALYVDVLVMSLDGNAFDAAWGAVVAALRDTKLPVAKWDADLERVVCEADGEKRGLVLRGLPVAATFGVFSTASPLKRREEGESWVLADMDGFEEELCRETVTVVVTPEREGGGGGVLRIEKSGGGVVDVVRMKELVRLATDRWSDWEGALRGVET